MKTHNAVLHAILILALVMVPVVPSFATAFSRDDMSTMHCADMHTIAAAANDSTSRQHHCSDNGLWCQCGDFGCTHCAAMVVHFTALPVSDVVFAVTGTPVYFVATLVMPDIPKASPDLRPPISLPA